jgi:hypothetical protein
MFADVRRVVEGWRRQSRAHSQDDDLGVRPRRSKVIDPRWLELFPDPESRPASHTHTYQLPDPMRIQSEFFGRGVTEWQPRTATEISIIH